MTFRTTTALVICVLVSTLLVAGFGFSMSNASEVTKVPPGSSGIGENVDKPSEVDLGQNAILPDADMSGKSAAPTMVFECDKNPAECKMPLSRGDTSSGPDLSPTPAAPSAPSAQSAPSAPFSPSTLPATPARP